MDVDWLVNIETHLGKVEKKQENTKPKTVVQTFKNLRLNKTFFERFNEHLPHFQIE